MNKLAPFLLVALLSGCGSVADDLGRWQDSLFVTPAPTEAEIREAMAYVGAANLPMPTVTEADTHAIGAIGDGAGFPVLAATVVVPPGPAAGYSPALITGGQTLGTTNGASIVLSPSWRLNGGEGILIHEAYNYARAKRGLPADDCGAFRVDEAWYDAQGWYGREHQSELGARLIGCED